MIAAIVVSPFIGVLALALAALVAHIFAYIITSSTTPEDE